MEGTVGVVATVEEEENVVMTDELIVRAPNFFFAIYWMWRIG
jgi:hypothetical protein